MNSLVQTGLTTLFKWEWQTCISSLYAKHLENELSAWHILSRKLNKTIFILGIEGTDNRQCFHWGWKLRSLHMNRKYEIAAYLFQRRFIHYRGNTINNVVGHFDKLKCRQLGQNCSGIIPCCGSYHCFWEGGFNMNVSWSLLRSMYYNFYIVLIRWQHLKNITK